MLKKGEGIKKPNIDLNIFEQYFKTVNNPDNGLYNPDDDILHLIDKYESNELNLMFRELNHSINEDEILKSIKDLKTNKSGGPYMILIEFVIHGTSVLIRALYPSLTNIRHRLLSRYMIRGTYHTSTQKGYNKHC